MQTLKLKQQLLIAGTVPVVSSLAVVALIYLGLAGGAQAASVWQIILPGALIGGAASMATAFLLSSGLSKTIKVTAESVYKTADEITATVEQRIQLANQQAAAANQTTVAMEELAASARQSAEQAESLAVGARQVVSLADEGASSVNQGLKGMDGLKDKVHTIAERILQLSEQASQIASITNLVTDVASRTNMLALNAAVEAARAGDQGKGFSVVAVEIRKLADQTKKSAERINTLVGDILKAINATVMATEEGTKTVDAGVQIANRTVQSFVGVRDAISRSSENTQQISLNAKQQALAVNEVLRAMSELSADTKGAINSMSAGRERAERLRNVAVQLRAIA